MVVSLWALSSGLLVRIGMLKLVLVNFVVWHQRGYFSLDFVGPHRVSLTGVCTVGMMSLGGGDLFWGEERATSDIMSEPLTLRVRTRP